MRRTSSTLVLAGAVLALAACGYYNPTGGSDSAGTPGPSAGEELEFTGYLFRVGGQTRICDAMAESFPPQCGGKSYRVTGLDFSGVDGLQEAQGVTWTERPVTLKGVLASDGETLMISANPAARGDGPPPPTVGQQPGNAPG